MACGSSERQREHTRPEKLRKLEEAGTLLDEAYTMGRRYNRDTMGWRAAWQKAERACAIVGDLIEILDAAEPILTAACGRVRR